MSLTIGIDPGLTGGVAAIEDNKIVFIERLPTKSGTKAGSKIIDCYTLAVWLKTLDAKHGIQEVILEEVHAMPKQGVSSTFSFGRAYGMIEGILIASRISMRRSRPQAWKKEAGILRQDKTAALRLAAEIFPIHAARFMRKADLGIADAALIARFG